MLAGIIFQLGMWPRHELLLILTCSCFRNSLPERLLHPGGRVLDTPHPRQALEATHDWRLRLG